MVSISRTIFALSIAMTALPGSAAAISADTGSAGAIPACTNPDALGTLRTLEVGGAPELGLKSYPQTLALGDHEVVLTFDDGPAVATTPKILDALKAECVEATFFLIGRNAAAAPALVRREIAEHHSVGHHTWDHPAVTLRGLTETAALDDIDRGMAADDKAAYGTWSGEPRVPFFRFPGFGDTPALLDRLKARRVAVFGADLWASDWIPMTPEAELDLLMERLRGAGRGIILLHDIKKQTAEMLPRFLSTLKAEGFHVVHIVPGGSATPTRPAPEGWSSETEKTLAHLWPKGKASATPSRPTSPAAAATSDDNGAIPLKGSVD